MELSEYKTLVAKPKKKPKYGNKKVVLANKMKFDSQKEATRWGLLNILQMRGEITNLQRQIKFTLCEKPRKKSYVSDFVYVDSDGNQVVEDVKGYKTANYMTKKAWMFEKFGIKIKET